MVKISVIIPTYNRAFCIKKAILSVIEQGFNETEILVIDDGSTDNTGEVVNSITDPMVKYYKKANGGASSARNCGLDKACGKYIAFLDSDDYWPKNYLATMISMLDDKPDYGVVYCTRIKIYHGEFIDKYDTKRCKSGQMTTPLFMQSCVGTSATVATAEAIGTLRFDETLKIAEDTDFFLKLSLQVKMLFVKDIKVPLVFTEGSLSQNLTADSLYVRERFYFELGGSKCIPKSMAMKKLSRNCLAIGKKYYKIREFGNAKAMFLKGIRYKPTEYKNYIWLVKNLFPAAAKTKK